MSVIYGIAALPVDQWGKCFSVEDSFHTEMDPEMSTVKQILDMEIGSHFCVRIYQIWVS